MTHTYQLTGMTCSGCEATVKAALLESENVTEVIVLKDENLATITMDKYVQVSDFQKALGGTAAKYQISAIQQTKITEQSKSWFETYKPIVLIFFYITLVTVLIQLSNGNFNLM